MPVKIKDEELAYIAGVIDSDGCISITRSSENRRGSKGYFQFRGFVTLTQTSPEAIELINKVGIGHTGISRQQEGKYPPLFRWSASSRVDVKFFLESILPYLRIKRSQAELVLTFCEHRETILENKPFYLKLKEGGKFIRTGISSYTGEEEILWQRCKQLNQAEVAL